MKKLMILTAILLFVATPAFAFHTDSPQAQYNKTANAIVLSVDVGSGLLASSSVGPMSLNAGLKTTDDTTFKYTSTVTANSTTTSISTSSDQSTSGFVSFNGTINAE